MSYSRKLNVQSFKEYFNDFLFSTEIPFDFVGKGGLEPPNSEEDRFTVCCNCRYATSPELLFGADRGTWTPDRLITNQLLYQLSYIGIYAFTFLIFQITILVFFSSPLPNRVLTQTLFYLPKGECKGTTFFNIHQMIFYFFLFFFLKALYLSKKKIIYFLLNRVSNWLKKCIFQSLFC